MTAKLQNNLSNEYFDQNFKNLVCDNTKLLNKTFDECSFDNCNFSETSFKNCKFRHCQFTNCNLSLIDIKNSSWLNVVFNECKIIGVNWTYALISDTWPLKFNQCNISQSNFLGLNLNSMSIIDCMAQEVDFRECNLSTAILTGSNLQNSLFASTNLSEANFINATNYSINLTQNKLTGAKFSLPEAFSLLKGIGIDLF